MSTSSIATIKLNVGGIIYQVSKSLLEKFPGSLLERCASNTWNEGGDEVFIEGNANRFQYVLDFMRHGEVILPKGESGQAFLKEMEYYGIECDDTLVHNINTPKFLPLVNIMKGNKKEKILDYTAAVIASDVIKVAGTEMLGGERSSFTMEYHDTSPTATGLPGAEQKIIYKYLLHYKNDLKSIIDMINHQISMVGLQVTTINHPPDAFGRVNPWANVTVKSLV
ncbi:POZ domain-containing protein [Chaetoceros tenuissimus]|uniref:POZ domain-containing protein n=1 Tax=Chaetoceros tenuissimus TaxID=426638 RepID=A0AAD3H265_9STRA|nr:POZ domain-containing protein [Chaetoceros tenuissimus]